MDTTHLISLSVATGTPEEWRHIYGLFSGITQELGHDYNYVALSSSLREDEEVDGQSEHETAVLRVYQALLRAGFSQDQVETAMTAMQEAGIVFRNRI